jgi:L-fuconolactonase
VTEARTDWTMADLAPYAGHVFDCFGPQRVMWGSDWPVLNLAGTYGSWRDCAMALTDPAWHDQVFAANAIGFYRLPPAT